MNDAITPDVVWVSILDACNFYGVSRRTIYNWVYRGKLVTRRTPGDALRIAVDRTAWQLTEDEAARVKAPAASELLSKVAH